MADSAALAGQIADYDTKRVTSTDAMNQALAQYGVPEIRNTVSGLRTTIANTTNALKQVDPSVTGRTQGSLVTEAQRQKQVATERAPIAEQLGSQTGALGEQQTALNDAMGQATQLATNRVNDWNTGRQALQSQYDTTYKREQDEKSAAQAAADRAESIRQFNVGAAQKSSSSNTLSAAQSKQQDMATIATNLESKKGKDNHVSQETWNRAMSDWVRAGYSATDFVKQNIRFINQRYKGYSGFN